MTKVNQTPMHNNILCSSTLHNHIHKIKVTLLTKAIPNRDILNKVIHNKVIHKHIHLIRRTRILLGVFRD
ncbi:hypothetical protein ANCDUO_20305 [Ancylostoma duodenale]|uniref:Uncharacterized protein n=1 Tax=Ancylostoma duodenale TaxID=51022 RepID=A0A0C2FLZ4_9BILA|nr:hypothetical protein ANCDUO_20305 [Ancylostoma duodenale]